jgi:hypothetical protein
MHRSGNVTLKSVKLDEKAIEAVKQFQQEFKLKNQSEAILLGLNWGKQFFSVEVQAKNDLYDKVKQLELLINAVVKQVQGQFKIEEVKKLIMEAQKAEIAEETVILRDMVAGPTKETVEKLYSVLTSNQSTAEERKIAEKQLDELWFAVMEKKRSKGELIK